MNRKHLLGLLMLLTALFSSCAKYFSEDEEEVSQQNTSTLRINPRSSDETELLYPIKIYAFNPEGECASQQTIASAEAGSNIELALPKGTYRIVALAGSTEKEYIIPESPSLTDVIEIRQDNKTETALMMGNADVTLKSGSTKANITLNFVVAQLKITLSNIPTDYSNVGVELSSTFSKLSFQGDYANSKNTLADCKRMTNGEWKTGTIYTFAGSSKKTIISIHLTKEDGATETYGYTYNNSIQANHPFILAGSYAKSITVEGNIIAGGWADPINVDFTFGKNDVESDDKPDDNNDNNDDEEEEEEGPSETFTVDEIPEEESIWNGCLVLEVNKSYGNNNEADVLLMGRDNAINNKGKEKMHSTEASAAIKEYNISEIRKWRIPTKTEAQLLKSRYNGDLTKINKILSNAGGTELVLDQTRYLCNNATQSFNFKSGTISDVGSTVTYYLRPVKTIHIIKE